RCPLRGTPVRYTRAVNRERTGLTVRPCLRCSRLVLLDGVVALGCVARSARLFHAHVPVSHEHIEPRLEEVVADTASFAEADQASADHAGMLSHGVQEEAVCLLSLRL